jgi:hypothetical protein
MSDIFPDTLVDPTTTSDIVLSTAPGFAVASLMISSAQAQARALENGVAHTNQVHMAGLATATQCVTKILSEPGDQLRALNAILAAQAAS